MKLVLAVIVTFFSVDCYAQTISKEDEFRIHNQVKVMKSYVEPWNTSGISLVKMDSTKYIKRHSCGTTKTSGEPMWIVDGKIKEAGYLKEINPNDIQSIEVLKGKLAIEKYGEKAKNGAILVTMKCKEQSTSVL